MVAIVELWSFHFGGGGLELQQEKKIRDFSRTKKKKPTTVGKERTDIDRSSIETMLRATRKSKGIATTDDESGSTMCVLEQSSARQDVVLEELRHGREATRRLEEALDAQRQETARRLEELEVLAKGRQSHGSGNEGDNGGSDGGRSGAREDDARTVNLGGSRDGRGSEVQEEPTIRASSSDDDHSPRGSTRSMTGSWGAHGHHFNLSRHAKLELECYKGDLDAERLMNWLLKLGQYFEIHDVPDYAKLKIMETRLEGHALIWWQYVKAATQYSPPTWPDFERLIKKKFMPFDMEGQLFKEFQNLKQGSATVKEYAEKLMVLST